MSFHHYGSLLCSVCGSPRFIHLAPFSLSNGREMCFLCFHCEQQLEQTSHSRFSPRLKTPSTFLNPKRSLEISKLGLEQERKSVNARVNLGVTVKTADLRPGCGPLRFRGENTDSCLQRQLVFILWCVHSAGVPPLVGLHMWTWLIVSVNEPIIHYPSSGRQSVSAASC